MSLSKLFKSGKYAAARCTVIHGDGKYTWEGTLHADFFEFAGEHRAVSFEQQLGVGVGYAGVAALDRGGLPEEDVPLTCLYPPDLISLVFFLFFLFFFTSGKCV